MIRPSEDSLLCRTQSFTTVRRGPDPLTNDMPPIAITLQNITRSSTGGGGNDSRLTVVTDCGLGKCKLLEIIG